MTTIPSSRSAAAWAMVACMAAAVPPCAGAHQDGLLVDEGFEAADLYHEHWWKVSGNNNGRTSDEFSREGKRSARFHVELAKDGDYRSEVTTGRGSSGPIHYQLGEEYWFGFSILPAPELKASPRAEVVLQFHNVSDPGESPALNPNLALRCDGSRWVLDVRGDNRVITLSQNYEFIAPDVDLGPVDVGAWTDWQLNVKWSPRDDGRLRLWKNGELVYDGTHPNCYNDQTGPYLKFGVYAWYLKPHRQAERALAVEAGAGDRIYFFDAVRIATGADRFKAVAPRGPRPPAASMDLRNQRRSIPEEVRIASGQAEGGATPCMRKRTMSSPVSL